MEDFKKEMVGENIYTAILSSVAKSNIKQLAELLRNFPKQKFKIILNASMIDNKVLNTFTDNERTYRHFSIDGIIKDVG